MPQAERDETVAGVGHEWHPRVANQRNLRALLQGDDQLRRAHQLIVFVVADQRLVNVVVRKELQSMARVFAGDFVDLLQDAQRPKRDVFEISDRRADKIEAGAGYRICLLGGSRPWMHGKVPSTRSDGVSHAGDTLSFMQYRRGALRP